MLSDMFEFLLCVVFIAFGPCVLILWMEAIDDFIKRKP